MDFARQMPVGKKVLVLTGTRSKEARRYFQEAFERRGSSVEIIDGSEMTFREGVWLLVGLRSWQSVMIDAVNAYEMPIAKRLAMVARGMRPRRYALILVADDDPLQLSRFADDYFFVHRASWRMERDIQFLAQEQESRVCEAVA